MSAVLSMHHVLNEQQSSQPFNGIDAHVLTALRRAQPASGQAGSAALGKAWMGSMSI